ncbi:caspase domain-containing protein [Streptomyces sp. NPDC056738]|uniref:caspase family protein n=1 Tax=Streptomyces sp. NPDC056738 TaxID=3345933 RepID=UPI0036873DA1
MTLRLPDPRGSRAVLIGTSRYDSDLPDLLAVRNNLEVLQELLTSDAFGGFPSRRCTVVQDAPDPRSVCATIREAAMTATDTLLVYFSGHGVLNDNLILHLALTGTDESDLRWTAIPFDAIREILEESPCPNKILILDCCNSGRVLDTLMGRTEPTDALTIRGTYILTSSANAPSYAPVGERYTAFTGEFIRLLRDGLPGSPELLTLSTLYDPLTKSLRSRGYPEPRQQSSDGHARLGVVRNRARILPVGAVTGEGPAEEASGDRPPSGEIRFKPSRTFHHIRNWGIALPVSLGLLVGISELPSLEGDSFDLAKPSHVAAALMCVAFVTLLQFLGRRNPAGYSLVLSPDGIELQYGDSKHFSYPWHGISRCWIRQRPQRWLRGRRYDLMVRPMPAVLPQMAGRSTPGPHQEDAEGTLRFADLRRIRKTPEAVESALATYAGAAWTPNPDFAVRRAATTEPVFTADRRFLAVVAVLGTAMGYITIPLREVMRPAEFFSALTPLVLCALSFGTAWFAISRFVRPVRLTVGAAGLTLTRGTLEIAYAWSEIERIAVVAWPRGVVTWPRGVRHLGLLVIRPIGRIEERVDRTNRWLPKLVPGALTLCLLPEVTHDRRLLETALARFADKDQLALPGQAWLRTSARVPAPPRTGSTFVGRQPLQVSALMGLVLWTPVMITTALADLPQISDEVAALNNLWFPLFFFGFLAYFLTGTHHIHLHIGPSGLNFKAFGILQLHIRWRDVERIGIVARSDPKEHALVLYPRHRAALPKAWWLPFRLRHGGLRILTLEHYRIDDSPEDLDQAIVRYAGRRHTRMTQLRQTAPKKK